MTLNEMAQSLGLKNAESLRKQLLRGVFHAERIGQRTYAVSVEEVERYRREHLGKRTGFHDPSHPYYRQRPPRKSEGDNGSS